MLIRVVLICCFFVFAFYYGWIRVVELFCFFCIVCIELVGWFGVVFDVLYELI